MPGLPILLSSATLVAACALLLDAGRRVAAPLAHGLLERLVAGFTFACAAAIVSALALGLFDLGATPVALVGAAAAVWLLSRILLPTPTPSLTDQLRRAWRDAPATHRALAGAAAGAFVLWTTWIVRYPHFGFDGVHYHMAEVARWVRDGDPGAPKDVMPLFPVGAYPLSNEVLLAWGAGIGRTQVVGLVWTPLITAVMATSGWLGLRSLNVPRRIAAVALAGLCLTPIVSYFMNAAGTDVPAMAWVVVAGGLGAAATRERQHGLAAAALVAAALAVGTKTTALPLAIAIAAAAAYALRGHLRSLARPLVAAGLLALGVGGVWYLRDMVQHGSPFWPFLRPPWADPAPAAVTALYPRFVEHPIATVRLFGGAWAHDYFGGGLIVVGAALLSPIVVRTRAVTLGAAATAASVLLWMLATTTGASGVRPIRLSLVRSLELSPRYFLPGLAAATLTVCLAARDGRAGRRRSTILAVLGAALAVNIWETFRLDRVQVPSVAYPLLGLALGASVTLALGRMRGRWAAAAVSTAAALALVVALSVASDGLVNRYTRQGEDGNEVGFIDRQPGKRPVYMAPLMLSVLAGDRFDRQVTTLSRREPCAAIRARAQEDFVIVKRYPIGDDFVSTAHVDRCLAGLHPVYDYPGHRVYGPARAQLKNGKAVLTLLRLFRSLGRLATSTARGR